MSDKFTFFPQPEASGQEEYSRRADAYVTQPDGVAGTGGPVTSGAGPDIGVSDLGVTVQENAPASIPSGALFSPVASSLPATCTGDVEKADALDSTGCTPVPMPRQVNTTE